MQEVDSSFLEWIGTRFVVEVRNNGENDRTCASLVRFGERGLQQYVTVCFLDLDFVVVCVNHLVRENRLFIGYVPQ